MFMFQNLQSELMSTKTSTPTTKDETKVCYYSVFDMCYQLSADTMQKPLRRLLGGIALSASVDHKDWSYCLARNPNQR